MDPYPAMSIHANHMDMTKFGGDDSAGYIKVLSELRRFVESANNMQQTNQSSGSAEKQAVSTPGGGGINFYGAITGDKIIAGTQTTGGTTNFTFN
jgi:hypothetical protein